MFFTFKVERGLSEASIIRRSQKWWVVSHCLFDNKVRAWNLPSEASQKVRLEDSQLLQLLEADCLESE
jgi:hypothetical protein